MGRGAATDGVWCGGGRARRDGGQARGGGRGRDGVGRMRGDAMTPMRVGSEEMSEVEET